MLICIGITGIVNSGLYLGMNTFIMPRFDLQTVCETVQSRRISYLYVVPPVALQLVQSPLVDRYDLRSLRLLNSAAAALSLELIRGLRDKRGITIRQQYGMSECSPCTHSQVLLSCPIIYIFHGLTKGPNRPTLNQSNIPAQ